MKPSVLSLQYRQTSSHCVVKGGETIPGPGELSREGGEKNTRGDLATNTRRTNRSLESNSEQTALFLCWDKANTH